MKVKWPERVIGSAFDLGRVAVDDVECPIKSYIHSVRNGYRTQFADRPFHMTLLLVLSLKCRVGHRTIYSTVLH